MKFVIATAAVALLAATSVAYADEDHRAKPDNFSFVTQLGAQDNQITIQTADPSGRKDQDPLNSAVTIQAGKNDQSFTLQSAKDGVTNAAFTLQKGADDKSVTIQGSGHGHH